MSQAKRAVNMTVQKNKLVFLLVPFCLCLPTLLFQNYREGQLQFNSWPLAWPPSAPSLKQMSVFFYFFPFFFFYYVQTHRKLTKECSGIRCKQVLVHVWTLSSIKGNHREKLQGAFHTASECKRLERMASEYCDTTQRHSQGGFKKYFTAPFINQLRLDFF